MAKETRLQEESMFRMLLIALAVCSISASPALSQLTQDQQKQRQKRESSGEAASKAQRGGLKRDRQIHQEIRSAHNRMHDYHYQYNR